MFKEVISSEISRILTDFSNNPEIYKTFYLSGETALVLQLGHRRGHDLQFVARDLFSGEIVSEILREKGAKILMEEEWSVHSVMDGVHISFIYDPTPLIKKVKTIGMIRIASLEDLACATLVSISKRAHKKEFYDFYEISRSIAPAQLCDLLLRKYDEKRLNLYFLLKSLYYFEDAEKEEDTQLITATAFKKVKKHFIKNEKAFRKAFLG